MARPSKLTVATVARQGIVLPNGCTAKRAVQPLFIVDVELAAVVMEMLRVLCPIFGYAPEIFGALKQTSRCQGG